MSNNTLLLVCAKLMQRARWLLRSNLRYAGQKKRLTGRATDFIYVRLLPVEATSSPDFDRDRWNAGTAWPQFD